MSKDLSKLLAAWKRNQEPQFLQTGQDQRQAERPGLRRLQAPESLRTPLVALEALIRSLELRGAGAWQNEKSRQVTFLFDLWCSGRYHMNGLEDESCCIEEFLFSRTQAFSHAGRRVQEHCSKLFE